MKGGQSRWSKLSGEERSKEVRETLKRFKNGEVQRINWIHGEMLKHGGEVVVELITCLRRLA